MERREVASNLPSSLPLSLSLPGYSSFSLRDKLSPSLRSSFSVLPPPPPLFLLGPAAMTQSFSKFQVAPRPQGECVLSERENLEARRQRCFSPTGRRFFTNVQRHTHTHHTGCGSAGSLLGLCETLACQFWKSCWTIVHLDKELAKLSDINLCVCVCVWGTKQCVEYIQSL